MNRCGGDVSEPILWSLVGTLGILLLAGSPFLGASPTNYQTKFFETKVRPLLAHNCYHCHSEQAKILSSNLRVDGRTALLEGGSRGPAIVPGDPDSSQLIQAVRYENIKMPPSGQLSADQINALVKWVEMGAPWPDLEVADSVTTSDGQTNLAGSQTHWAWKLVERFSPPSVRDVTWPCDPIDNFILEKLATEGLKPSSYADRYTLLRRVYFDLTSLPPEPADIYSYVSDDSELVFEKVVEQLLNGTSLRVVGLTVSLSGR